MTSGWRGFALIAGGVLAVGGIAIWLYGGGPFLIIVGAVTIITALAEPIYGRAGRRPSGSAWRPTGERFLDPESGKLVTVWFDPVSGDRRYVSDGDGNPG